MSSVRLAAFSLHNLAIRQMMRILHNYSYILVVLICLLLVDHWPGLTLASAPSASWNRVMTRGLSRRTIMILGIENNRMSKTNGCIMPSPSARLSERTVQDHSALVMTSGWGRLYFLVPTFLGPGQWPMGTFVIPHIQVVSIVSSLPLSRWKKPYLQRTTITVTGVLLMRHTLTLGEP